MSLWYIKRMPIPMPPSPKDVAKTLLEAIASEHTRALLESIATFLDKHDIIVPELTVKVGLVEVGLSAKKLEDEDAKK